jgi:hypothetical protein
VVWWSLPNGGVMKFGEQLDLVLDCETVTGISCRMTKHVSLAPVPNTRRSFNLIDDKTARILLRDLTDNTARTMKQRLNNMTDERYAQWFEGFTKAYDKAMSEPLPEI